jgi:hypothetical protein
MQQKTHTPGPWRVEQQDDMDVEGNGYVWAVRAEGHGSYCQNPARSNSLANARLMAAAPDMLAALEEAHRSIHGMDWNDPRAQPATNKGGRMIRAAIAKAKGAPTNELLNIS